MKVYVRRGNPDCQWGHVAFADVAPEPPPSPYSIGDSAAIRSYASRASS